MAMRFFFIFVLALLSFHIDAQVVNNGLIRESMHKAFTLFYEHELVWNGQNEPYLFTPDGADILVYDIYSCPCTGVAMTLDTTSVFENLGKIDLESYSLVRLDDKQKIGEKKTFVFVFCNKLLNDEYGDYTICRIISTYEYKRTIIIKMYVENGIVCSYTICDEALGN